MQAIEVISDERNVSVITFGLDRVRGPYRQREISQPPIEIRVP